MIEDSLRTLAPVQIITDKRGEIIKAFVAFYGEHRRSEIEERLNNVLILKVSSVQSLERNIERVKESIIKENFEALNDVVNEYYKNFSFGISGKIAIVDYYKKEDNDNARIIAGYVKRKNKILNDMRNYLKNSRAKLR